jgi:outer membrane protein assembly factor BamD
VIGNAINVFKFSFISVLLPTIFNMKNLLYILFISGLLSSCSDFQKALKSEDISKKFEMGTALFEEGKWNKANRLFAQIVPQYRGKPQAEKLMYMYSMTFYNMEDFYVAAYQFERFETSYPNSEKVEEAAYLGAKSAFMLSPKYSKEQKETIEAIERLQLFINKYPESELLPEANQMVKELDNKLERKAFEIAKQYNLVTDYPASIKSCENFILDFPGSIYREATFYVRFDSAYRLAINSVEEKKEARVDEAMKYFEAYKKSYPNAENMQLATEMYNELTDIKNQYNTKS